MSKFNSSDADQFKYLSPTNADNCWRELVRAAERAHPFKNETPVNLETPFSNHRDSMYHSTYSVPKRILLQRARETDQIPSAGIAPFHKEAKRPELGRFVRNAEYQQLIADHMRNECGTVRSTASTQSRVSIT